LLGIRRTLLAITLVLLGSRLGLVRRGRFRGFVGALLRLIGQSISFQELPKSYLPGTVDTWCFILAIQS
jgi:hypothetical protein